MYLNRFTESKLFSGYFFSSTSNTGLGSLQDPISAKRIRQESHRALRVPKIAGKCQNLNV